MSKQLNITGIKNIKHIAPQQLPTIRQNYNKYSLPPDYLIPDKQCEIIRKLYIDNSFEYKNQLNNIIKNKLDSYKQQDKKHEIYSDYHFISLEDTIQKLLESKMKCKYCNNKLLLIYSLIRDPTQWTLDRIDNNYGHNTDNVVICCLKCNLERRNTNMDKFLFTKQLVIKKSD